MLLGIHACKDPEEVEVVKLLSLPLYDNDKDLR
jgi:hypothetical protein